MKNRNYYQWCCIVVIAAMVFCISDKVNAGGWEDIWKNVSVNKNIQDGVQQQAKLYGSDATFTINNGDGVANNFGDTDRIKVVIRNAAGTKLEFGTDTPSGGTKLDFIEWAKKNSDTLLKVIFPASPESSFAGASTGQFSTQQFLTASFGALSSIRNNDIQVSGQYDFFEVGPTKTKATGSSGMVGYGWDFGEKHNTISISIPYRYVTSDDALNSTMGYFALVPSYKYRFNFGSSKLEWLINLSLGGVYLKSSLFPDGGGYLEYGGGTGVSFLSDLMENLHSKIGLHYQYMTRNIPDSLVPDELKWVSTALNNLPAEQDLTVIAGLSYEIFPKTWDVSTNLFRIHQLQSGADPDSKYQTVWNILTGYSYDWFRAEIGYKTSFEVKNYTDNSIIASIRFEW